MAIASRLSDTGTYYIAGEFDEVSQSSIRLTLNNQFAAFLDEVSMHTTSTLEVISGVAHVFFTGSASVGSATIGGYYYEDQHAFSSAIYAGQVPIGSRVYIKWDYNALSGPPWSTDYVDMGIVTAISPNPLYGGGASYVTVTNPYGASRPTNQGAFLNSNIVAYSANAFKIVYPTDAQKRETNTGTIFVSGYFDEVTKFPGTLMASSTYDSQGWVSASTDYSGVTQDFVFYYPDNPTGQTNSGGARTVPLPYDGSSKYYAEILITAIDTSTHDGNPYNDGFSAVMIGVCGDSSPGGTSNVPCIYLADGTGRGTYSSYNIPSRPDPQPSYNNSLPNHFVPGDTFMIAYDSATNKVYFGRNGQWSIDPTSGSGITIPGGPGPNSTRIIIMSAATFHETLSGRFRRAADLVYPLPSGFISAAT